LTAFPQHSGEQAIQRSFSTTQPLNPARHEIRVLKILPELSSLSFSRTAESIQCVLQDMSPDDVQPFHALSYACQDEALGVSFNDPDAPGALIDIDEYVFLDGIRVDVTENLWVALWHLRRGVGGG
jgi:hypothetical protein